MPGDQVALMEQLHAEHAAALWGYCLRLTANDRVRAEDVAQETLLRAWRHFPVLDDTHGSVRAWLFTVARNIVIDEWRTKRAQSELPVAEAVTTLTPEHRAVRLECYYRGRSVADTAERLGIPEGTVKSRTHYALRALRLALEEMGVGA